MQFDTALDQPEGVVGHLVGAGRAPMPVTFTTCQNPDCDCDQVTAEVHADDRLLGWVAFSPGGAGDGSGEEEIQGALRALPRGVVDAHLEAARHHRAAQRHRRDWRVPPEVMRDGMVCLLDLMEPLGSGLGDGELLNVLRLEDGEQFEWDLLVCPRPHCNCDVVVLYVVKPDEDDVDGTVDVGRLRVSVDFEPEWESCEGDEAGLRRMFAAWVEDIDDEEYLRYAYDEVKAAGRRSLVAARPARKPARSFGRKPSRNAPCPCGSGRRYKACCGGARA
jgi:hypothetical protein